MSNQADIPLLVSADEAAAMYGDFVTRMIKLGGRDWRESDAQVPADEEAWWLKAYDLYEAGRAIAAYVNGEVWKDPVGFKAEAEANARRIVALWNAAAELGLSTEAIEGGALQWLLKSATLAKAQVAQENVTFTPCNAEPGPCPGGERGKPTERKS